MNWFWPERRTPISVLNSVTKSWVVQTYLQYDTYFLCLLHDLPLHGVIFIYFLCVIFNVLFDVFFGKLRYLLTSFAKKSVLAEALFGWIGRRLNVNAFAIVFTLMIKFTLFSKLTSWPVEIVIASTLSWKIKIKSWKTFFYSTKISQKTLYYGTIHVCCIKS